MSHRELSSFEGRSAAGPWSSIGSAAFAALTLALAACGAEEGPGAALSLAPSFSVTAEGAAAGELVLCKYTNTPTSDLFDFAVSSTGGRVPGSGHFTLSSDQDFTAGPECAVVWRATNDGAVVVTIEEEVQPGWELYRIVSTDGLSLEPAPNPVQITVNSAVGTVVFFKNRPVPVDMAPGRMTGGGSQFTVGGVRVTRGFTIHCDITLSNNVEINWEGHRWHLDKPLTSAICIDDPAVEPAPPPAPFDTFVGEGWGRLNNVDGSFLRFTFVDSGEPGGRNDRATIRVWAPGANPLTDAPVLSVDGFLDRGNLQAHYDQPHR